MLWFSEWFISSEDCTVTSFTIHDLDDTLEKALRARARSEGSSLNKTVKKLLEQALGFRPAQADLHRADFEAFHGAWSKDEQAEFEAATADLGVPNPEDWR